jgi:pimeloyl-ACP methyl ester carboxylesterase
MDNCVADLPELLKDLQTNADHGKQFASLSQFDTIMGECVRISSPTPIPPNANANANPIPDPNPDPGWSMGAQTAITCLAKYPKLGSKLFLLNPSSGKTLHTVLQSFAPLPEAVGRRMSSIARYLIVDVLRPLIPGPVWGLLQSVACSFFFRAALEAGSFFGGSPPEQGAYFHRYMKDVFERREQTRGLLDLIVALDSPVPPKGLALPHATKIISGIPDFMTGVYHATQLAESMPNSTHVSFTMGSHFVLIEWPELVALEALEIINAAR